MWCPGSGSGVVLDCSDFRSLPSYLLKCQIFALDEDLFIYVLNDDIVVFYIFIQISIEYSVSKQWRPCTRRLILVCTVCLCPTKKTLDLYGLNNLKHIYHHHHRNMYEMDMDCWHVRHI